MTNTQKYVINKCKILGNMKERRKNPRVSVSFPIECKELTQSGYFCTVSKDLSISGARIVSNDFMSKDDSLRVNINLIDSVVPLKAKVVWCKKERVPNRYSIGLEFIELTAEGKSNLARFLNKVA